MTARDSYIRSHCAVFDLQDRIREVTECVRKAGLPLGCSASKPRNVDDYPFTDNPAEYKIYWDVRKGLIPIVGAAREPGVAFPPTSVSHFLH